MILIDALFINDGGGKVLLDYLISEIEKKELEVHYILDQRIKSNHPTIISNKITYLEGSILKRHEFYRKNRKELTNVLCFGNLPPSIKLKGKVYTYFHNRLYIEIPKTFSFIQTCLIKSKTFILNKLKKNTNFWLVQSELVKSSLRDKFNLEKCSIQVIPFFPPLESDEVIYQREENTFIYVSADNPHKNHVRLINAFCAFYDKKQIGFLTLTVSKTSAKSELLSIINEKIAKGYPIKNIGFVKRDQLFNEYCTHEFLIFPSLSETFGLGIIEAINCGCKVLAADLPYTHEVCEPSLTFNPLDEGAIVQCLLSAVENETKVSEPKIYNQIENLINMIQA